MRRIATVAALIVLSSFGLSCGSDAPTGEAETVAALDCPSGEVGHRTFDYVSNSAGNPDPRAAAKRIADTEVKSYDDLSKNSEGTWVVSKNGEPIAKIFVARLPDGTHRATGMRTCAENDRGGD